MHGVAYKQDVATVEINICENDNDPILGITDLLTHLSLDQLKKWQTIN